MPLVRLAERLQRRTTFRLHDDPEQEAILLGYLHLFYHITEWDERTYYRARCFFCDGRGRKGRT